MTEDFLNRIRDEITTLFISIREAPNENGQFSLHHLFEFLDHTDTMENAIVVERIMQGIWMAHEDHTIRKRLDDAISDLSQGEREKALISFIDIVNDDPSYAEAWNKISACQFLMGEIQASIESATKRWNLFQPTFKHWLDWEYFSIKLDDTSSLRKPSDVAYICTHGRQYHRNCCFV